MLFVLILMPDMVCNSGTENTCIQKLIGAAQYLCPYSVSVNYNCYMRLKVRKCSAS